MWKTIKSEVMLQSEYVTVKKDKVQLQDGAIIEDFYTVKIQDASLIVALTDDNQVLLKTEYRYACGEDIIECPAGMIENGEQPIDAAKRELYEETGFVSDKWLYLGPTWESTSKLTNKMHLFLAKECKKAGDQHLDKNEQLQIIKVSMDKAIKMVMDGKINANSSAHALLKSKYLL